MLAPDHRRAVRAHGADTRAAPACDASGARRHDSIPERPPPLKAMIHPQPAANGVGPAVSAARQEGGSVRVGA